MFITLRFRAVVGVVSTSLLLLSSTGLAVAAPNPEASCVGLASSFFARDQIRDDVAGAIKVRFGIPPGAEVSRFARVQLGDLGACLLDGQ